MKIDTLILSACGCRMITYIGVFKCLLQYKVIDLNKIKKFVSCSAGSIISVLLIITKSLKILEIITLKYNQKALININDLNTLFENNGLFNNNSPIIIKTFLKHYYNKHDITLLEFYKLTKVENIIKVYNISKEYSEYISHKTHPNLSLLKLINMTTSIPIFFKPVIYDNSYYIDGGFSGCLPTIESNNTSLMIKISSSKDLRINLLPYEYISKLLFSIGNYNNYINDKRFINIEIDNVHSVQFDIDINTKKDLIKEGYNSCYKHLKDHNLV